MLRGMVEQVIGTLTDEEFVHASELATESILKGHALLRCAEGRKLLTE